MKISKQDALMWFSFFSELPEDEMLMPKQQEIVFDTLAQIERTVEAQNAALMREIPGLKSLEGRSYYVGPDAKFPIGCKSCLLGSGLSAIRKTNRCNANCPFCYDYGVLDSIPPIGDGYWEIGGTKFTEDDFDLLMSACKKPTGISYVYLEPMLEIEKYYGIVRKFKGAGIHQHLYTNGICANEENLRQIGEAGLDELRFNLGATNCADKVIEAMGIAKKYIPQVGIETPMTPQFYAQFAQKKEKILATGIDFINCAELHLTPNNICNYEGENLYCYRRGYISPIWSRQLTLKLMKQAAEEHWDLVIHDCDNRTKFARDLHLKQAEGGWFGASAYGSDFDTVPYYAFLPVLSDESFSFIEEEPLPAGYQPGELF